MSTLSVSGKAPTPGASISVLTSGELAALDVSTLTPGTFAYVSQDLQTYQLTLHDGTWQWEPFSPGGQVVIPSFTVRVTTTGDDSNDGVTGPVKTLERGAFLVCQAGGGTVEFEDSVWASPTFGKGLKLFADGDTGMAGPGWIDQTSAPIKFKPYGGPQRSPQAYGSNYIAPGGGAPEFTEPVLQLAGTQDVIFEDTMFWTAATGTFPTVRIGLSSPLTPWNPATTYTDTSGLRITGIVTYNGLGYYNLKGDGTNTNKQPDISPTFWAVARDPRIADGLAIATTAFTRFRTCQFTRAHGHVGPAIDHGYDFFTYFEDGTSFSMPAVADNSDIFNESAVRYTANGTAFAALQYYYDVTTSPTGIVSYGPGEGVIRGLFQENGQFPTVSFFDDPNGVGLGTDMHWHCTDVQNADASINEPKQRAIDNQSNGIVYAEFCFPCTGRVIQTHPVLPSTPGSEDGLYGVQGAVALLQQDSSRRTLGPSVGGPVNIAWQPPAGSTFTTAPDGTNTAMSLAGTHHTVFADGTAPQVLANGDRLAFGSWFNWTAGGGLASALIQNSGSGPITFRMGGFMSKANTDVTLAAGGTIPWLSDDAPGGLKNWLYYFGWLRVISRGSGRITILAGMPSPNVGAIWAPYAGIIPAADALLSSDSEVMMAAAHAQPPASARVAGSPDTIVSPAAGCFALRPGQTLGLWDPTTNVFRQISVNAGVLVVT